MCACSPSESVQPRLGQPWGTWLYRPPDKSHDQARPGSSAAVLIPLLLHLLSHTVSRRHRTAGALAAVTKSLQREQVPLPWQRPLPLPSLVWALTQGSIPPQKGRPGSGGHCWSAHCRGLCQGHCQCCFTLGVLLPGWTQEDRALWGDVADTWAPSGTCGHLGLSSQSPHPRHSSVFAFSSPRDSKVTPCLCVQGGGMGGGNL